MCGRFTITVTYDQLEEYVKNQYDLTLNGSEFSVPSYNVAPATNIISIINDGKNYRVGTLKWGFLPPFPIKNNFGFINAKAETLFEKPSFKKAALFQRCVVLADGYYEWKQEETKIPYLIKTKDGIFKMAAIWNTIINPDGTRSNTVAIITTNANKETINIHERMPVILNNDTEAIWLNPNIKDSNILKSLLKPYDKPLIIYPVSTEVNFVRNNYPNLTNRL